MQLIRIHNRVDATNTLSLNIKEHDAVGAVIQVCHDSQLSVDLLDTNMRGWHLAQGTQEAANHLIGTVNGLESGSSFATSIAHQDNIVGKQIEQSLHVAVGAGTQELGGDTFLLLVRDIVARTTLAQVLMSAVQDLAAIGLAFAHNSSNLRVIVVKDLAQQKHRSFQRTQALQHDEKSEGKRLGQHCRLDQFLALARWERLRQPGANVEFALYPGRAQLVDAKPHND